MRSQRAFQKRLLKRKAEDRRSSGHEAIVAFQHILLWTSVYVLASEVYMLASRAVTSELLPSSILLLTSSCVAMIYIACHMTVSFMSRRPQTSHVNDRLIISQWLAKLSLRVGVTLWMAACGLNIVFTIARQPHCIPENGAAHSSLIHAGKLCVVQRTGVGASLLAMRPFCTIAQDLGALSCQPLWYQERLRLASTLAVPCPINRQSNVFRNVIQVPVLFFPLLNRFNLDANSLNQSLAAKLSRKGHHRLGNILCQRFAPIIPYASSVFELHTNAHNNCIEKTLFATSATSSILSGCVTLQGRTVRMVPPSPAPLLSPNPVALKRSEESLSSMYSRSISGESRRASAARPALVSENRRTYSSGSTTTVVKSRLGTMRLASEYKDVVSTGRRPGTNETRRDGRAGDGEGDSDIDDAATLQARLPLSKSHAISGQRDSYYERPRERDADGTERRLTFTPLNVKKTRDSAAMFSARHVDSVF
ncbi:hypothetical protein D0863_15091 [Hortaea werneckii]|uniref:Uncharacterized protein n=1 Tax=Hortaea werneckii TaxID=91943 RepID=A0A3M7CC07_HORWE|nr:hypothetical protein D0863_15091 [Hortaea werneckii]